MKTNEEIVEEIEDIVLCIARPSEESSRKINVLKFFLLEALEAKDSKLEELKNKKISDWAKGFQDGIIKGRKQEKDECRYKMIDLINKVPVDLSYAGMIQWKEDKLNQLKEVHSITLS